MFRGFELKVEFRRDESFSRLEKVGKKLFDNYTSLASADLSRFIEEDNSLDGAAIQKIWFSSIDCDIFISHSHKDIETVLVLAGWLWERFSLKAFVDSSLWGSANVLQKKIDDTYCLLPSKKVYSYELRNHSTSHVHMMLSTALAMMIDRSECLFFINTPNALQRYKDSDKTESPWIYSELAISQIIEKREPKRLLTEMFSERTDEIKKGLSMKHDLDLRHLRLLDFEDLMLWKNTKNDREHPLDTLYTLFPPEKRVSRKSNPL